MADEETIKYPQNFTHIGPSSALLLTHAEAIYWRSLRLELSSLISALHTILSKKSLIPELNEEDPSYLSDHQRLSIRIIPYLKDWWPFPELPESEDFEVDLAKEALLGFNGVGGARAHQNHPIEYRLARAMLSSAGFLDVSKIVEYRTPQFPSQCGNPQLAIFGNRVEHLKGADGRAIHISDMQRLRQSFSSTLL